MKNILILGLFASTSAMASYYQTLPKGRSTLVYRFVKTGSVEGSYNDLGNYSGYNFNAKIDTAALESIDNVDIQNALATIKGINQDAYDTIHFGEFSARASSRVSAHAFGFGHGISDRLTLYGFTPFYKAEVDIDVVRTSKNNISDYNAAVQTEGGIIISEFPDVSGELLQSLFVNYMGYKPIGTWRGQGLGDMELGAMYRLTNWKKSGLMVTPGIVLPTGREDDPDIVQDIGFGDGQWDFFLEFGGGYNFFNFLGADSFIRYTHQLAYKKEIRLYEDADFPVSAEKGKAKINPGDIINFGFQLNYSPVDWITLSPIYLYDYQFESNYRSGNGDADKALEKNTESYTHSLRLNLNVSTIDFFFQKKFFLPMHFNIAGQTVLGGRNTYKYKRIDLEARLFF